MFGFNPRRKYVAVVGDVGFPEYSGGVIIRDGKRFELEYVEVFDPSGRGGPDSRMVYRMVLEPRSFDFVDWKAVARSTGQDATEYQRLLKSGHPVALANLAIDAAGHYGWIEFDQYPLRLSLREAEKRYARVKRR